MRRSSLVSLPILLAVIAAAARAQPAPKRGAEAAAEMSAMVDQLAQTVFTAADANHNRYLSKREFENAEAALATAVNDWGRQGLIGKPKRPSKTDSAPTKENSADAIGTRLAKSNRTSQPEFAIYVHAVVEQADQDWRAAHATADAQRKAYNQYRSYYRPRRGPVLVPVP
jgi:hypothetical protein